MLKLVDELLLDKCPYCNVDKPNLIANTNFATNTFNGSNRRHWQTYVCKRCGGAIIACRKDNDPNHLVTEIYPAQSILDNSIPDRAKKALQDAIDCLHSPSPAIISTARSVDAMLKAKDLKEGSLFTRINKAAEEHLITDEMAKWAHEVRLEANDERHADEDAEDATEDEARRVIDFAKALAEFLFVLPSRVQRGIEDSKVKKPK